MQLDVTQYQQILGDAFARNGHMQPKMISLLAKIEENSNEYYTGCIHCHNKAGREVCVCINNSVSRTMLYYPDQREMEFFGNLNLNFSYTGGCYYPGDGCIYGFPRNSNRLLKIDIDRKTTEEVEIGLDASAEIAGKEIYIGHHYGGVLVEDTAVCPPRLSEYLLLIDLRNYTHRKLYSEIFKRNFYSCALAHPNGKVYFTPSRGSAVAEFDPKTETVRLVSGPSPAAFIGGTVYGDGCIYLFSQGNGGLFRFDPEKENLQLVINKVGEVPVGWSHGAITHLNGKIYNIAGSSKCFYEYDPRTNGCRVISTYDDGRYNWAKWAGGALLENGNIFLVPCGGRFAAEITFTDAPVLTAEMRSLLYETGYLKPI